MAEPPNKRSKTGTPSAEAGPSNPVDNPYLAHMRSGPSEYATGSNGAMNGLPAGVTNPLKGLVPRKVSVDQAKNIMVSLE